MAFTKKMGPKDRIARARAALALRSRVPRSIARSFNSVGRVVSVADPPPWSKTTLKEQRISVIKTIQYGLLTSSVTVPVFGLFMFAASQISDIASLGGVFDQYKIDWVELLIQPSNSSASLDYGQLVSVVDYDDVSNPGSVAALLDYNTAIISNGSFQHYHKFRPRIATAVYGGAVFSSFANSASQWIDMASTNVEHYGVKVGWTPTAAVLTAQVFARLHVSFRSTR